MTQKGFLPIVFLVVCAILGIGAAFGIPYVYRSIQNKTLNEPTATPETTPSTNDLLNSPTSTSTATPTVKTATTKPKVATKTPTPKPVATSSSSNTTTTCNYNLSSATGAVQLKIQPQTGNLTSSATGELYASSGCKVLDGRSTDHLSYYRSGDTVMFSTVPPGTYTVRVLYKDSWSSFQTVTVTSGNSSYAYFPVSGDTAPTPTPNTKPVCTTPVVSPSTSGTHPFNVTLYIGYSSNPPSNSSSDLQSIMWDFTGDGSYDYTIGYGNPYEYTYQNAGTYTLKGSICKTGGSICSDPCQTTITVN